MVSPDSQGLGVKSGERPGALLEEPFSRAWRLAGFREGGPLFPSKKLFEQPLSHGSSETTLLVIAMHLPLFQMTMADFSQKQRKQHGAEGLGSVVDFLLANARLVLGVGGAAVLGIATLAVKRVRPGCQGLKPPREEARPGELGDSGAF